MSLDTSKPIGKVTYNGTDFVLIPSEALDEKANLTIVADDYDNTSIYTVGDYCIYEGVFYKCNTSIATAEEWTAAHWTEKQIANELIELNSDLDDKQDKPLIKTTMDAVATVNTQYYLGTQTTVAIILPSTVSAGQTISVVFYSGATATTLSITGSLLGDTVTPNTNERIEMNLLYDGVNWVMLSNVLEVEANA